VYAVFSVLLLAAMVFLAKYSSYNLAEKISINTTAFALIAIAVVMNRVKKIVIDPILIGNGHTLIIAVGYAFSLLVVLVSIFIARNFGRTFELSELFVFSTLFGIAIVVLCAFKLYATGQKH
jgi:hypothetical protein